MAVVVRRLRLLVKADAGVVLLARIDLNASLPLPGDANRDGDVNEFDIGRVRQSVKYLTGKTASWSEGDWNGDGVFDQHDIVAALQTGRYLEGASAAAQEEGFGDTLAKRSAVQEDELVDAALGGIDF